MLCLGSDGYTATMKVLSIRLKRSGVYERLKLCAARRHGSVSSLGERLIDEGLRMEAHPGIVFRDGPSGRRAGLAAGADVWEIAGLLRGLHGSFEQVVKKVATQLRLTEVQVEAAYRYYLEFVEEIDAELAANDSAADDELAMWENERLLRSE